jgi:xanthine dehydrogenase accessory factor
VRDVYREIAARLRDGFSFAVATLVSTRNAAPAPIGTSLLVASDGSFLGNVGAGCHEGELVEAARATLRDGRARTIDFDLADELLDGSACGAAMTVVVWRPGAAFESLAQRIAEGLEDVEYDCDGHGVIVPAQRSLLVVGATDLAAQLSALAQAADFTVTVVDPRAEFATSKRLPNVDRLVVAWPQDALPELLPQADAIVVVSHDAKIDLPALRCALDTDVAYIGVLGSRRNQRYRREVLAQDGYDDASLDRIAGPTGLDIGAVTNGQVACSILAEVLTVLNGRSGLPLRETSGRISGPQPQPSAR